MSEPLFLSYFSPVSKRTAIIADEGDSVWLYLTGPGNQRPDADCWLLNTPSAPSAPELSRYRAQGLPPPAPASIVDPVGVQVTPSPTRWSAQWSERGDAVAVALDGTPIGALCVAERRGFARYLLKSSPWGNAWDPDAISRLLIPGLA